ncbi:MAG: DUF5691 domain-containing protein [Planctomycetota bacterium]|nr:DUF5691 domain-containing protein [Planctomycetota bacterium]
MNTQRVWEDILRIALLGTERQEANLPALSGELGETLASLNADDREGAVLSASAAVALYRRAGVLPARLAKECAADTAPRASSDLPRIGSRAAGHLALILSQTSREVLPEWLAACAAAGKRVPEERLPALLDLGEDQDQWQDAIRKVVGLRGQWLAKHNEDWHWAMGNLTVDERGMLEVWQTAGKFHRLSLLVLLREKAPDLARQALQSTWREDSTEDRADFLEQFDTGLSIRDEPFLEECLDDRRKEIRQLAEDMLLRIPESRLRSRAIARARSILSIKGMLKKTLEVNPPSACDDDMQRDGIDTKGAAGVQMGEKAFLLMQVVGQAVPSFWCETLKQTPEALLKLAAATDWEASLRLGWQAAARTFRNGEWIEALMDAPPIKEKKRTSPIRDSDLIGRLSPESFERIFKRRLKVNGGRLTMKKDDEGLVGLLQEAPRPWTIGLALEILKTLKTETRGEPNWHMAMAIKTFALALPPEVLAEALNGWPTDGKYWEGWKEKVDSFLAMVQFRHDMLKALKEE